MSSCIINTPFCCLKIHCHADKIVAVDFIDPEQETPIISHNLLKQVEQQLQAYCQSSVHQFDLPLSPRGTEFQQRVWAELCKIPAGQVKTYGDIARRLATSPRAVGNACRKNPIPVIIPCHRVVSKKGIGGFAGATDGDYLKIKHSLLSHEGVEISRDCPT